MSIFTVSQGDAATFQAHYQRLVEAWLQELLNLEPQRSEENKSRDIRVTDGKRVVYGRIGETFRNELTPELIEQLEELRHTSVGNVVDSACSKTIEVDGQVVLKTDESGKVIINEFLEKERVTESGRRDAETGRNADVGVADIPRIEEQGMQGMQGESSLPASDSTTSALDSSLRHAASYEPSRRKLGQTPELTKVKEGGVERVRSSVDQLPDSSLKQMLTLELNETRAQLQRQQQQIQQLQTQPQGQQQELAQALENLIQQRLAKPTQTSWWQRTRAFVTQSMTSLSTLRREHAAAQSLKTLFHSQVSNGGRVYQADDYTIVREGRSYTLTDKSGMTLMQFQSSPLLGVRVERDTVRLQASHYRDIRHLQLSQVRGEALSGALAPAGVQETDYLKRVRAVTEALSQYARSAGSKVQVDGKLSYRWLATPDGRVRIDAKDGRGPLLVQAGGQLRVRMSDRDLAHFEQMLPTLNSAVQHNRAVPTQRTQQLAWERN
ncbi:hypothetical protein [Allocoleopsis franciscana]|uniref:Uncharacterized protein n=1 Tax=Allocoleopsis franciscana PCC 7113 TaxID=1173027 RepID=K9WPJ0_9CYAN|nr:hypothetical protein [Allocoleopsis franciscana]AFZ22078.1 hypothetical protein Mic7113_6499 [Allocoleopsis franciscana PCC 7113]